MLGRIALSCIYLFLLIGLGHALWNLTEQMDMEAIAFGLANGIEKLTRFLLSNWRIAIYLLEAFLVLLLLFLAYFVGEVMIEQV